MATENYQSLRRTVNNLVKASINSLLSFERCNGSNGYFPAVASKEHTHKIYLVMRQITSNAVQAFVNGENFSRSNTSVEIRNGEAFFYLHGNMIAHRFDNSLFISTCGWRTNTTKERLNGILNAYNLPTISQVNFEWRIDGEDFTQQTKTFNNIQ